jgi:hypothetical protein
MRPHLVKNRTWYSGTHLVAARFLSLVMGIVVALTPATGAADSLVTLTGNSAPVPADYFCLNILFHPLTKVPWPAVPFVGWRLSHAGWPDLEPQKGQWNFALLDRYAGWAQDHHAEILMVLAFSPQWASSSPDAKTDTLPGISGVPRDMEDWKMFVRTVATRYKGRIHHYEVWNEPNRPQSWTGDVDTMIAMLREASQIVREVDPTNTVIAPAPEAEKGLPWFEEFLRKGGAQYVDVLAYHFYVGADPPEAQLALIQKVKRIMAQFHVDTKPLWDTEAGWHDPRPFPSDELAAAYVARAYVLHWAAGVSRFYWYAWDNHSWTSLELTEKDNTTLRPAGNAYRTIEKWMNGSVLSRCADASDGTWVCDLTRNGTPLHIVWNTTGKSTFSVPASWHVANLEALEGGTNAIQGTSVAVGVEPLLFQ